MQPGPWFLGLLTVVLTGTACIASFGNGLSKERSSGYIDFWLKFIGVEQVQTLVVEGTTWPGKEKREQSIARGLEKARKLAADF